MHSSSLLDDAGDLRDAPEFSADDFPQGVNVEFAVVRGPGEIAMRVYERGVGETQSCGTGACAVAFREPLLATSRRADDVPN